MATNASPNATDVLDPSTSSFYCHALTRLSEARLGFLVGGAYAFGRYTGIERHTKDFDIFVRPEDCQRALELFEAAGFHTELTFPHWLGKAFCGDDFVDVIFGAGNGVARVDDTWFEHAVEGEVFGMPVKLIPPEEMVWSKAFIMERERFDGADVAHLLRACAPTLDWRRLLDRFGDDNWRVLFAHLVLFGFIYPAERTRIPAWVLRELQGRLERELECDADGDGACQGTLLSRAQYLVDVDRWGYEDPRLKPRGSMTADEIAHWTAAIQTGH